VIRLLIALAVLPIVPRMVSACPDFGAAPSSRWTIVRRDGIAWLVTPCGERFFSAGVNTLDGGAPNGEVNGRPAYYWKTFYPDLTDWLAATRSRMTAWGFNTVSATSLAPDLLRLPGIPDLELGRTARFHWFDPFDPAMEQRMRETARRLVAPYAGGPYRIGYFSDNEVGWWNGALFSFYLEKPPSNHTKQRLVAFLRESYRNDWRRFTRDFVPPGGASSFADLLATQGRSTLRPGGDGMRVVRRWTGIVAGHYYRLVHDALHAADPDALVFGDRLPIYYDPAAVRAMAPWVDAIAINYDVDSPDGWIAPYFFDGLRRLSGNKPVLVSEWFFAARENRTGNVNNGHLMTVATQAERASGAAAAAEHFAREPSMLGMHWFQFYDHPKGGRADGEDYNFGLVDVHDRPYDELIEALTHVNARLASIHAERSRRPPPAEGIPEARIDASDRSFAEWPKDRARIADFVAPPPDIPFGDVLLAWDADALSLALVAMDYHAPDLLPAGEELPRPECFHVDLGVDAGRGAERLVLSFVPPRVHAKGQDYAMRAELCRMDGRRCASIPGAQVTYFGADQPRIRAEVRIPWDALGVDGTPPRALRMEVAVTGFHRARWMSWSGRPPALAMRDPARWRRIPLLRRG
jgi:hypothetical protein